MSTLRFTESHEYVLVDPSAESLVRVGISQFAADQLGDVVYVEMPEVGKSLEKGDIWGSIESVKTASDLYMPVSGRVVAINEAIADAPQRVNDDCYAEGWLIEIEVGDPNEVNTLMTEADYQAMLANQ
jgi:glycine cleavage system H protein